MWRNIATELIRSVLQTCIDETPTTALSTEYVNTQHNLTAIIGSKDLYCKYSTA